MNQQAKAKRDFPYVTLILIVTLVLVVAILGYTVIDSFGFIGRLDNAAKSDNFRVNENHVDVYRYHVAQNELYYQFMYIQYGMMQDPTGGYITSGLMDVSGFINYMLPNYVGTDSFDESAYEYAKQYLTYCEGAKAAGKYDALKADAAADIDEYIDGLKELAESNEISFSKYLSGWIGKGVSENDVRQAMEYYYVGVAYADELYNGYRDGAKDDEIDTYVKDHMDQFYTAKHTSYVLADALINPVIKDLKTEDEKKAAIEKYVESFKTSDDVKTAIVNHYVAQKFDDLYKTHITDKKVTDTAGKDKTKADVVTTLLALNSVTGKTAVFFSSDTDAYKKAAYTIANTLNTTIKTETQKVKQASAAYADPTGESATDLQKWLCDAGRKVGDTHLIVTKNTDKDGKVTYTYTWYVVDEAYKKDTEKTKDAYYVYLTSDKEDVKDGKTAAEKAEAFYAALTETKTEDKFVELIGKYAPTASTAAAENISYNTMKSSNQTLADWLFEVKDGATVRKEGDITKIEVKGDTKDPTKVTGVYIAYFVEENEETWKMSAREKIASEKLNDWFDENSEKYNVTVDYEPETTTTTAAQ